MIFFLSINLTQMKQRFRRLHFAVFTDDVVWARATLSTFLVPSEWTMMSGDQQPVEDFIMLTYCDHFIITLGSYGWWAAYINPDATVVYWGGWPRPGSDLDAGFKSSDYYPSHWISMNATTV